MREIQLASRKDLRTGGALLVTLLLLSAVFLAIGLTPRFPIWAGVFWSVIWLIRGFRLRREAWELENLGYIQRERDAQQARDRT